MSLIKAFFLLVPIRYLLIRHLSFEEKINFHTFIEKNSRTFVWTKLTLFGHFKLVLFSHLHFKKLWGGKPMFVQNLKFKFFSIDLILTELIYLNKKGENIVLFN